MRDTSHNSGVSNHQTLLLVISRQSTIFHFLLSHLEKSACSEYPMDCMVKVIRNTKQLLRIFYVL